MQGTGNASSVDGGITEAEEELSFEQIFTAVARASGTERLPAELRPQAPFSSGDNTNRRKASLHCADYKIIAKCLSNSPKDYLGAIIPIIQIYSRELTLLDNLIHVFCL